MVIHVRWYVLKAGNVIFRTIAATSPSKAAAPTTPSNIAQPAYSLAIPATASDPWACAAGTPASTLTITTVAPKD